jgi:hypothetical protein
MYKLLLIAVVLGLLSAASPAEMYLQGIGTDHELSSTHDRFYSGADKAFIGQGYDWSGIGRNQAGQWAVMISPSYFVSAYHAHPDPGDTLTFHSDNNAGGPAYVTTGIIEGILIPGTSDLYLGKLTTPIPAADNIATYPLWTLSSTSAYVGKDLFVYGTYNKVGRNSVYYVSPTQVYYTYNATGGDGPDEAYLESGDSGGPSFGYANGQLALLGVHWTNSGSTPYDGAQCSDSYVAGFVAAIQASMVGETLSTTSLSSYAWSATSGNWCTNSCWSPATLPGATDAAVFNLGGTARVVNVDSAKSVGKVSLVGSGALTMNGNLLTVANAVSIAAGQTLQGSGNISAPAFNVSGGTLGGALNLTGNVVSIGGQFTPGGGAKMSVTGSVTLDSASVVNYMLGAPGGANDQVTVSGDLTLDGTLNVTALTGFGPAAGSPSATYTLLTHGGTLTNNNPKIIMPATQLNSLNGYNYTYSSALATTGNQVNLVVTLNGDANGDGVLDAADIAALYKQDGTGTAGLAAVKAELKNVFNTCLGDTNLDHKIDLSDFQALEDHWMQSGTWATGDFNGDGVVDYCDFQVLLDNWDPAGLTSVPEPASASLLLLGGLILRRNRK